jgi:uncharacterized membrane protein required for colicin V production
MFAAAISKTTPWWQNITYNWFDGVVMCVLLFGLWRGRKHGMSGEILPLARWLALTLGAGFGHAIVGELLIRYGVIKAVFGNFFNIQTAAQVTAYLLIALAVFLVFSALKHYFQKKLQGSNSFGDGEYYLGTPAGMVRYACMLMAALALLNAPVYSAAEIQAQKEYDNREFGAGLKGYSGNFFPKIYELQADVFQQSLTGPLIKAHLSWLLINTAPTTPASGPKPAAKTPVIHMGN